MRKRAAIALMTILFTTQCSEWVPASVAEATGQERVRVQRETSIEEPASLEGQVITSELAYPSRRTLVRLRREGAHFEVRHSNVRQIMLPAAIATFGAAVLGWLVFAVMKSKPSFLNFGGGAHSHALQTTLQSGSEELAG